MKGRARRWWAIYALGALLSCAALAWITRLVVELEHAEARSRARADHQANLRLALWRMDSWLGPLVAREAARGFHEYRAFYPQEQAYTRVLASVDPGAILAPSPLLTFHSEHILLHFEIDERGAWSSPQIPEGNELDLAQGIYGVGDLVERRAILAGLAGRVPLALLAERLGRNESALVALSDETWIQQCQVLGETPSAPSFEEIARNTMELSQRARQSVEVRGGSEWIAGGAAKSEGAFASGATDDGALPSTPLASTPVRTGPLVPVWLDPSNAASELVFVRRVATGAGERFQGFLVSWPSLSRALLAQVQDLFPDASLAPCAATGVAETDGLLLATLPAALTAPVPADPRPWLSAVTRLTIALPWLAILAALVAVGFTLRSSIDTAERRSRFASSVTHELRTPLTTFRMYSEMLAKGMVPEEKRAGYYQTLERESARLAGLVESVLAYSRLEEGRARFAPEPVRARELVERSRGDLERRAVQAGALLSIDADALDGAVLATDAAAVHQILFNLVDNACKYGLAPENPEIELAARADGGTLTIEVGDHGPGVPRGMEERIFSPFDRGSRDASDPNPGIGLGLALARGLARDLGGDLSLVRAPERGARFRLVLPLARAGA